MPRVAALSFAAALSLFWAQKTTLDDPPAAVMEEASADVTSIIFQTDDAIGTF